MRSGATPIRQHGLACDAPTIGIVTSDEPPYIATSERFARRGIIRYAGDLLCQMSNAADNSVEADALSTVIPGDGDPVRQGTWAFTPRDPFRQPLREQRIAGLD
jgi:hypothetical protein